MVRQVYGHHFLYHHCDFDDCHVLHHFHSGAVGAGAGGRLLQWHHQPGTNRANGALFAKRFYEFHDIGFLIAPYFFQFFGEMIGNAGPANMILWSGIFYVLLAVYDLVVVKKDKLTI